MRSTPTTSPGTSATSPEAPSGFAHLGLDARLLEAIAGLGFEQPTPIQNEAIPHLMEGRDIIGGARTGSGKTAAFGLPLVHQVREGGRKVRALVLAPTRELARQVAEALDSFARHLPARILPVYGGVGYRQQLRGLASGVSVVVGTPGRVLDHIGSGALDLSALELFVLDEADEMLNMGFLEEIERVLDATPDGRQIALFSATMPPPIRRVAERYLNDPIQVQVESQGLSAAHVQQRWLRTSNQRKTDILERVLRAEAQDATLIFARTRARVAELAAELNQRGFSTDALHGDLSQAAREMVLARFRARSVRMVVATDVAARGLDVDHITHVINYDLPDNSETYVHRIGRTARAGRQGLAITFITGREQSRLKYLQRDLGQRIERMSVPDDAQIAARQRASLMAELDEAMDASGSERAEAWLAELLNDTGWSPSDVAAAALSLLALERHFDLRTPPPTPAPPPLDPETRFDHINDVELFFPAGRRDGLRPADFVGALCNQAGLPAHAIGRITLGGHKAFVGLPREAAEHLLQAHTTLEVRGTAYPLRLAFNSQSSPSSPTRKASKSTKAKSTKGRPKNSKKALRKAKKAKKSRDSRHQGGAKKGGAKGSPKRGSAKGNVKKGGAAKKGGAHKTSVSN
ncbi:MAG: DEAD/DEAH box helicase [Myxococcota bacterium]